MKSEKAPTVRRLVRVKEAAAYLGMSAAKVRNLTQAGRIPVILPESTAPWLFDIRDLDAYIDRAKTTL